MVRSAQLEFLRMGSFTGGGLPAAGEGLSQHLGFLNTVLP
jgi:hypothetical protein